MCHFCAADLSAPSFPSAATGGVTGHRLVDSVAGRFVVEPDPAAPLSYATAKNAGDLAEVTVRFDQLDELTGDPQPLTDAQLPGVDADLAVAVAMIEDVAAVDFAEVDDVTDADIVLFGMDDLGFSDGGDLAGAATFPGSETAADGGFEAFSVLNTNASSMLDGPEPGGGHFRLATSVHELLHVLGLAHPSDTGNDSARATGAFDTTRSSVMSLNREGGSSFGQPVGPMALDIAALHALYGSASNNEGDTTYRLTDPGSASLDVTGADGTVTIGRALHSIWDTGGRDEIVYSGAADVLINLNPATLHQAAVPDEVGEWLGDVSASARFADLGDEEQAAVSDPAVFAGGFLSTLLTPSASGGFTVANGMFAAPEHGTAAVIEDARGGVGDDLLVGNGAANHLVGSGGADLLHGAAGNDTLAGGDGADEIFGGSGADLVFAGAAADRVVAGDGADVVRAGRDADSVQGGAGDDRLLGEDGNDSLDGGSGNDLLQGFSGEDALLGADGRDHLYGGPGGDTLSGDAGADTLQGGRDGDALFGGDGADRLLGEADADALTGGAEADWLVGGAGRDTLQGNRGDDSLFGGDGNDVLRGGRGDDMVRGDAGSDTLRGDLGSDTLVGGAGADVFVHRSGDGDLYIADFDPTEDALDLTGQSVTPRVAEGGALLLATDTGSIVFWGLAPAFFNDIAIVG